ncbi:hypothetical protein PMAYCL1PPCAC_20222, partial [Pristionchus mayeri]
NSVMGQYSSLPAVSHGNHRLSTMTNSTTAIQPTGLSLFEQLPMDILWKIIDYIPSSSPHLRLTSHMLRRCVDEYALRKPKDPVVDEVRIYCKSKALFKIWIYLPDSNMKIFQRRLIPVLQHILAYPIDYIPYKDGMIWRLDVGVNYNYLLTYLGQCIGRSKRVTIECDNKSLDFKIWSQQINKVLKGIAFDILHFDAKMFTYEVVGFLLKTIKDHGVRDVTIVPGYNTTCNPTEFLLELSSLVRSLCIVQNEFCASNSRIIYFFCLPTSIDWSSIIPEMFSNKIDTLLLRNCSLPGYISLDEAESLKEKLPKLDKKIWFSAEKCFHKMDYVKNERSQVGDYCAKFINNGLFIAHSSREDERFEVSFS